MIRIGLDLSLNSSACVIRGDDNKTLACISFSDQDKITKKMIKESECIRNVGIEDLSHLGGPIKYVWVSWTPLSKKASYSEVEYTRAIDYDRISDLIVNTIKSEVGDNTEVSICIEGYSQGLTPGKIIELVSFSSLVRLKMIKAFNDCHFEVVPPTSLKKFACETTYGITLNKKGKKQISRSPEGVAGGSFKKPHMYKALTHFSTLKGDDDFTLFLKAHPEYLELATIPKPIDDMVDAYWLSLYY